MTMLAPAPEEGEEGAARHVILMEMVDSSVLGLLEEEEDQGAEADVEGGEAALRDAHCGLPACYQRDRRFGADTGGSGRPDRDFKITAMWVLPIAPGAAVLGYFVSMVAEEAFYPLLGVAGILAVMGVGFWVAGEVTARWYRAE